MADVILAGGVVLRDVSFVLPGNPLARPLRRRTRGIVLHHTGADAPRVDGFRAVSATAGFHTGVREWSAIGYHVMINRRPDWTERAELIVYQTLPLGRRGAGARGLNGSWLHVALEGNTTTQTPTPHQYEALEALVPWLEERYPGAKLIGHREAGWHGGLPVHKDCPGAAGMRWVRAWRAA